jgi:hypothetical protein
MGIFLKYSITLVELLVAVILIGLLIFGISSLDTYARFHLIESDRRVQVQNETFYVLEHMAKNITGTPDKGGAIGDINQSPIDRTDIDGDSAIRIRVDYDNDGQRGAGDKQVAYRYRGSDNNYEIWYYPNYTDFPDSYQVISENKITSDFGDTYASYTISDNYLEVAIRACWDPDETVEVCWCGSVSNPQINIKTRFKMPAVSVN